MRKFGLAAFTALSVTALCVTALPFASHAADPGVSSAPVGTVSISAKSVAIGVGYTWGDGVLQFHGHTYHFSVKGLDVAAVGASRIDGHGRVYDMTSVSQFSGTYAALTGEATLGRGQAGQFFKNGNGVMLRVDEVTHGAKLSGSADGFELTIR